jgi:hypothetical protein
MASIESEPFHEKAPVTGGQQGQRVGSDASAGAPEDNDRHEEHEDSSVAAAVSKLKTPSH